MNQPAVPATRTTRCGCCWRTHDDEGKPVTLGALAMPGRRTFMVCQDCVNFMWHSRHPMQDAVEGE